MTDSTLLLVRHGQSTTNAEGVFTGWADVPLTCTGREEASHAGQLLRAAGLVPDVVHTSMLGRAIDSAQILLEVLDRSWIPVRRSWRLNERQYGALAGRRKAEVRAEVGATQFQRWRRSLQAAPPPMTPLDLAALRADPRYAALPTDAVPASESLTNVIERVLPYWTDVLAADLQAGRIPLVVAHGNSLRALITHLDRLSKTEVEDLNIPTGIPLCYRMDAGLRPYLKGGSYLDPQTAADAALAVPREGGADVRDHSAR